MFGAQVHPAFIQGLMLHAWAFPESAQADLINTMIFGYVQAANSGLSGFRLSVRGVHSDMQRGAATAQAGLQNMECSPGYTRLSHATNLGRLQHRSFLNPFKWRYHNKQGKSQSLMAVEIVTNRSQNRHQTSPIRHDDGET